MKLIYEREFKTSTRIRRSSQGESFPKKSGGSLRKGNRLKAYRFIEKQYPVFGPRWLLRRCKIWPNAYYNYRRQRKSAYHTKKSAMLCHVESIYHEHHGVCGYRTMSAYRSRKGCLYSRQTIHKYMNCELKLKSLVRPKRPAYLRGKRIRYSTIA